MNWLANFPPIPSDVLPRVVMNMPKYDCGNGKPVQAVYREWVRSDGEIQHYVIYEVEHG
jgi:hypothetical protein